MSIQLGRYRHDLGDGFYTIYIIERVMKKTAQVIVKDFMNLRGDENYEVMSNRCRRFPIHCLPTSTWTLT